MATVQIQHPFIQELMQECMTTVVKHHSEKFVATANKLNHEPIKEDVGDFLRVNWEQFTSEATELYNMVYDELSAK